ncbi:phosphonate metabolism transcriptional regulator PhnF [Chelativorans xinjiangense]|uniref:phosphonate metabolism transcriptional regulator PhnF n=1 Tax=Chelativorans xinjiangense TaxID=2681485 RepID=UPI00135A214B|nr:phosphonate metabolism transcriptional regulator PhnF [Chelativorans xinjiangense]
MTTRPSGSPLWQFIADSIAREIHENVYAPGDRLPTEADLAQRFGVNRHTVRRAVASLQDLGLIRIEQGRGTFVQEDIVDYPLSRRTRFSEIVRRQAKTPSGTCLRSASIPADQTVAEALAIRPGAPVALIETVGMVDGQPVSLAAHHFPLDRFPGLFEAFEAERGVTPMFRRLGVEDYLRKSTRITARLPDTHEMRHLRVARMTPVLCLDAVNVDGNGTPIEFGQTRFASGRVQILVDMLAG